MLVECPGCNKVFRAHVAKGHLLVEYKDIHGQKQVKHSDTCHCNKKRLVREGKGNGRNNE